MKTRLRFCSLPVALSLVTCFAAAQAQQHRTIEIGEFTGAVQVSLNPGDTLRVVLPATPSTGYNWHVASSVAALKTVGSTNAAAAHQQPGAAGTQALTFKAVSTGKGNLVLDYSRPWEKNKPAERQYGLAISVGGPSASPVTIAGTVPLGNYSGKLPCADCSGIQTSINFYAEDSAQSPVGYFVRSSTYLGKPTVFIDAGRLQVQKGTPDDPNRTIYSLKSNTSDHMENYLLQGDTLVPLGEDGKPIQAPFNLSLKRQS